MSTARPSCRALRLLIAAAAIALAAAPAAAQDRPASAIEFAAGALIFADDGYPTEPFAGGTGRIYLSPRVSVGPEVGFISGEAHSHFMLTGNVTVDLLAPRVGAPHPIVPFFVAGAGLYRTREDFPGGAFTSSDGAFTTGGGVRAQLGGRVFVGAEARLGWETHIRVNGLVGIAIGE